ncbi:AraC-like DNA-binding protein [Rhizobium sp. PP-F2F-G48]|uniref:helix-turn-helix domain-containing protein n=1 Tax=Rhizobium sp. PP-F2F-G48 TaxID=2135651 RepID=UPI0010462CE4|nr:helix-turn-helix domain-containing protein [Rhizobium sp. PP-F2F-G48]TCM50676.1 AraC-like DNA-binding protein [Rhizobium sp. PP-F2F-G48]
MDRGSAPDGKAFPTHQSQLFREVAPPRAALFKDGACRSLRRRERNWGAVHAEHVHRTGLGKEETASLSSRHLILLNLQGEAEQGEYFLDGRRASFVRRRPGAVLFVPAGCRWQGWEVGAATASYLAVSIEVGFVKGVEETASRALPSFSPDLGHVDPIIAQAIRAIGSELAGENPYAKLLVEGLAVTIIAQLARKEGLITTRRTGGLSTANLNRILRKIDENLSGDLSLTELSTLTGLSVPHFCRAFKETIGTPPHAYILHRRIERAKDLLGRSRRCLTDIALDCGFSSSSHLSNNFRRSVGTTPSEYRAALQPAIAFKE